MSGSVHWGMFFLARIICGLGIGILNSVLLPFVSELSTAHDRGSTFSLVFIFNYVGICIVCPYPAY